jgi:hypothetical protein
MHGIWNYQDYLRRQIMINGKKNIKMNLGLQQIYSTKSFEKEYAFEII